MVTAARYIMVKHLFATANTISARAALKQILEPDIVTSGKQSKQPKE